MTRRYEFYVPVARSIFEILFLPWEHKIHIFELMCNVFYYINVLITPFLTIFRRFSKIVPKARRTIPNIHRTFYEDCRRRPKKIRRCFDRTPTNSIVVEGTREKFYETWYLDCPIFSKLDSLPIFKGKSYLKQSKLILNWTVLKIKQ